MSCSLEAFWVLIGGLSWYKLLDNEDFEEASKIIGESNLSWNYNRNTNATHYYAKEEKFSKSNFFDSMSIPRLGYTQSLL